MENFNYLSLVFFLLFFGYQTYVLGQADITLPKIFPDQTEYIINATETLSLRCLGKTLVSWSLPNNNVVFEEPELVESYSVKSIESRNADNKENMYESVLTITNISYLDVGFYYCRENTSDINDLTNASSIYVYVYDTQHLSVLSELPIGITVIQHSKAILPCRPTSPDISVEIEQNTGEEVPLDRINEYGNIVTYDRRIGYTISRATDVPVLFQCFFTRGSQNEVRVMFLNIELAIRKRNAMSQND